MRCATLFFGLLLTLTAADETALDRYVKAPDSHFKWELVNTMEGKGFKAYVLDMTSQKWRTEQEVGTIRSPSGRLGRRTGSAAAYPTGMSACGCIAAFRPRVSRTISGQKSGAHIQPASTPAA